MQISNSYQNKTKMKVSVLGAGNGGCALAFHLVRMGHEVLLYQDKNFEHLFTEVKKTKQIIAVRETEGKLLYFICMGVGGVCVGDPTFRPTPISNILFSSQIMN